MNILIISKYASVPKYSKVCSRLFYLSKEFVNLGHKVTLIVSDSNHLAKYPVTNKIYNFEIIDNVNLCWINTKKYYKTFSLKRFISWLDFEIKLFKLNLNKIDKPNVIIVSSLSILSIIYGYYLKKKFNALLVFEIRDIWPLTMTEEAGFPKYHPLVLFIGFIEKFGYKNSDLIVGTMPKLNLHIKNILGYEKPFHFSPLGFNPEDYQIDSYSFNPFDDVFPKGKIIVGYAGSMGISNALETFIETIKLLDGNDKLHFMLVGNGDLKPIFQEKLKNCKNVNFLNQISKDQVKYFLQKCDILYLSTKNSKVWNYGQSMNKIVEYMLSGKIIIASYNGYPSMINESNCGYFIKTSNPNELKDIFIKVAYLDENERKKIGEKGKNWIIENRKYSKLAVEYIEKIKEIMVKNN